MRKLFSALLLLCSVSAWGQSRITANITITNRALTSNSLVVNGTLRWFTNSTTANTIATNLTSINATKTNLFNQIAAFPYAGVTLSDGNTNSANSASNLTLRGAFGATLTVFATGTWCHIQMHTQSGSTTFPLLYPMDNVTGNTNRTNSASDLVAGFSKYSTNAFTTNATALSNHLTKGASPQQYVASPVQFNGLLRAGAGGGVTNLFVSGGTNVNGTFSNVVNYGNAIRSEGSGGNSLQVGSNALARGDFSIAIGNSALASNANTTAVGLSALATNLQGTAIGNSAQARGEYSTAVGASAVAGTNYSTAFGNQANASGESSLAIGIGAQATSPFSFAIGDSDTSATAYDSLAVGRAASASKVASVAIGGSTSAAHSNSVAIGTADHLSNGTATTTTNQIRLGTANHVVSAPGFFQGTVSNLVTASGQTNVLAGDLSTPRAAVTTIANGANRFSMGTNVFIDLTGTPSAAGWSVDGIIFGAVAPRDGHTIKVRNGTGYDATFVHNSGLEATAAYRISTATSTNVIFTNAATAELIYSASASRWLLWNVFSGHTLTASATNAMGHLDGTGTNGTFYQTAANVALKVKPLIGAGGHRFSIEDTNANPVVYVDTNNVLTASNAVFRGDTTAKNLSISNGTSTSTARVGGTIFVQTNVVGLTNKGFTCLLNGVGTTNFPANFFEVGRPVILDMEGVILTAAGGTFMTNQVRLGGTMIASNNSANFSYNSSDMGWTTRVRLTPVSIGASGQIRVTGWFDAIRDDPTSGAVGPAPNPWLPYSTLITVDTTAALSFGVHSASATPDAGATYVRVTGGTIKVE